ncbi:methyltransferase domain-containing protein [Thermostilla marina]
MGSGSEGFRRTAVGGSWLGRLFQRFGRRSNPKAVAAAVRYLADCDFSILPAKPMLVETAGGVLETLMLFGRREAAERSAAWLRTQQQPDGSVSNSKLPEHVFQATAGAVRGWSAVYPEMSDYASCAEKAARFLREWVASDGRLVPPSHRPWSRPEGVLFRTTPDLYALLAAGRRWPDTDWTSAALRAVEWWIGHPHANPIPDRTDLLAQTIVRFLEWGKPKAAAPAVAMLRERQGRNGGLTGGEAASAVTLGWAALAWFRLGEDALGEAVYQRLEAMQKPDGGFLAAENGDRYSPVRLAAAKLFLDAAFARVECGFEKVEQQESLESNDPRVQAVRHWLGGFPAEAVIANVGCGDGRYLRFVMQWCPNLGFAGIDFALPLLRKLPPGVQPVQGSMLRVPYPDGAFDGAFAVDALCHSLVPEDAVAELCRIVRPGGGVLLIEPVHKRRTRFSWEQDFKPEQIVRWMQSHCGNVSQALLTAGAGALGSVPHVVVTGVRRR